MFSAKPGDPAMSNTPSRRLDKVKSAVQGLVDGEENDVGALKKALAEVLRELDAAMSSIQQQQQVLDEVEREGRVAERSGSRVEAHERSIWSEQRSRQTFFHLSLLSRQEMVSFGNCGF